MRDPAPDLPPGHPGSGGGGGECGLPASGHQGEGTLCMREAEEGETVGERVCCSPSSLRYQRELPGHPVPTICHKSGFIYILILELLIIKFT